MTTFNNNFYNDNHAIQSMYNSALARYKRKDNSGAADTIRNIAKNRISLDSSGLPMINFYKLQPLHGSINEAIESLSEGRHIKGLRILKHIQLEFHYGRLPI